MEIMEVKGRSAISTKNIVKPLDLSSSLNKCSFKFTSSFECPLPVYKGKSCKKHFMIKLKQLIRRKISVGYKDPVTAYATFDFKGKGKITLSSVLNHKLIK